MKIKFRIITTLAILVSIFNTIGLNRYVYAEETDISIMERQDSSKDIVDIAISDNRFKTLVTALKAAELVDTLKGQGPFTVFAPTDAAFAKLPKGAIDNLLKPENKETLVKILTYHVVPGKLTAEDVLKLNDTELKMFSGDNAKIEVKDNNVYIDGAKVIVTDIIAKNGIIHVIDTVMMP
ncbi:fasciclin domain-containing protein [Clostridium chromiireducens]|uniref:Fasciclin domain-containing protein n=1 Tax=Clostridium chromiireducens TaxID=225345 RepID=A0A399ILN5_9CLOT|nr:fasciclin domain-containing protein [Clostridium chromiireducens]RII33920.1 fasciclin domain-containing protein [Clostridium chromiireducens]